MEKCVLAFSLIRLSRTGRRADHERRDLLDGLRRVGYKVNNGMDDAGVLWLLLERGGGYYFGGSDFPPFSSLQPP